MGLKGNNCMGLKGNICMGLKGNIVYFYTHQYYIQVSHIAWE